MEDPLALAGVRVEPPDVSLVVLHRLGRPTRQMGGPDDDGVASDDGRGVESDLASDRVEVLIHVLLEVDDAIGAEARYPPPGGGVKGDELISRGDVEDLARTAVVSKSETASGAATRISRSGSG